MNREASLAIIRRHYPNAITTTEAVDRLFDLMDTRFGLRPRQIMHADSICSDDVNSIEYSKRAYEMLGPFKLGGLDGFPFAGLTGMKAFGAHVPDDGGVFIFHAPHIGVSKDGALGSILRVGQSRLSACCGACRAAVTKLLAGEIEPGVVSELDHQQNTIEQILLRHRERIQQAEVPLKEATEVLQEAITERIDVLSAQTQYQTRFLILMGAVLINGDHDMGAFTSVRRLTVKDLRTGRTDDMVPRYFA